MNDLNDFKNNLNIENIEKYLEEILKDRCSVKEEVNCDNLEIKKLNSISYIYLNIIEILEDCGKKYLKISKDEESKKEKYESLSKFLFDSSVLFDASHRTCLKLFNAATSNLEKMIIETRSESCSASTEASKAIIKDILIKINDLEIEDLEIEKISLICDFLIDEVKRIIENELEEENYNVAKMIKET